MVEIGDKLIGYATNPDTRNRGTSGGLVTSLLGAALENGLVDGVIIFKKIDEYEAIPIFTDDVQEVLASGGSMHTVPANLAKYTSGRKVALSGKSCDVRGIIEDAKRNEVSLDDVYIIGLNCGGCLHPVTTKKMLIDKYQLNPHDIIGEEISKGKLIFKTKDGSSKGISIDELENEGYGRRESCRYCEVKIPINADLACGNWGVTGEFTDNATFCEIMNEKGKRLIENAIEAGYIDVRLADLKSIEIREKVNNSMIKLSQIWKEKIFADIPTPNHLSYYIEQFANCINCGACKEACPVCTCGEESKCTMYNNSVDNYKMSMYHLVRLLHLSDSCIGCGQCTDVCPVDIPLTNIYRRFADPAQKKRNYMPGMDLQRPPFLELMLK